MLSLRTRTLLMILGVLAVCMMAGYVVSESLMNRSFRQYESHAALQSLERARILLIYQATNIKRQVHDYGVWNASYEFIETRDATYIEDNFSADVFQNYELDYVVLLDTKKTLLPPCKREPSKIKVTK
jgi:sensor domain CHASE-containing protein